MTSRRRRFVLAPAVIALLAVTAACSGSDDGGSEGTKGPQRSTTTVAPSSTTTEAPLSGAPLVVAQQGVSTFPDPFDQTATLGGYGVVLQNPNPDVMATGVHVRTRLLDAAGNELLVDNALLNAVMPDHHMAVGRTLIEPIAGPTRAEEPTSELQSLIRH